MLTYQEQKQKVLQLFEEALVIAQSQNKPEAKKALEEAKKHLAEEKLYVVVCGEFKQGKSSLLNALINETEVFPVDVDIATNIVSTITYGSEEKITVILGEIGKGKAKEISRAEIPNYVTEQGNKGNSKKARMLIIESPNPQLEEGLVLVDTPGVGGLNVEHTALTYTFIPNADAILFVTDVLAPLSEKELNFITERIYPHCQNLIFVVTKIDAVSDYKTIVESNRQKLVQVLNLPPEKVTIVPVSSKNKLDYLKSQDEEDLQDSNFEALEKELWQLITQQRGKILLAKALSEIAKVISEIQMPLEAELSACKEENKQQRKQQTEELKRQFQEIKKRQQSLLENNAEWQKRLNQGLEDIRDKLLNYFGSGFVKINTNLGQYLNDTRLLETPQEIATLLESDIDALMSNLGKQLNEMAAELHADIENNSDINLNPFEVQPLDYQKSQLEKTTVEAKKSGVLDNSVAVGRGVVYGSAPGAVIGGAVGGLISGNILPVLGTIASGGNILSLGSAFPPVLIGAIIVGIAAQVVTTKQQLSQLKQKDKAAFKAEVVPIIKQFVQESRLSCEKTLKHALKELQRFMRDELINQIKQEKKKCEEVLKSLQKADNLSDEKAEKRVEELQQILKPIKLLRQKVNKLAQATLLLSNSQTQRTISDTTGDDKGEWADE